MRNNDLKIEPLTEDPELIIAKGLFIMKINDTRVYRYPRWKNVFYLIRGDKE